MSAQDPKARLSVALAAAHPFFGGVNVHRLHFEPPPPLAVGAAPPPPHDAKWARRQHSSIWAPELAAYDFSGEKAQPQTNENPCRRNAQNKSQWCMDHNCAWTHAWRNSQLLTSLCLSFFFCHTMAPGPSAGRGVSSGAYAMCLVAESPHERGAAFLPPPTPKPQAAAHPRGLPRGLPLSGQAPRRLGPASADSGAGAAAEAAVGFAALTADRGVEGGIAEGGDGSEEDGEVE